MKPAVSKIHASRGAGRNGFALVVTVSLLALLSVVALGMLSLSAVSLRSSSQESAMMEARANARLALMIAIGELQKEMGPDMRVSGRALTMAKDARVGATLTRDNPRAWWVGVAGTNPACGLDGKNPVSADNPAVAWLVSGLKPGMDAAQQLQQPFSNPVDLLGEHSIDVAMTGGQALQAGIVKVDSQVPGHVGGYAWIVDDEGLKAQIAPSDTNLINTASPVSESDLTPGAYDLSVLHGMTALKGAALSTYTKMMSTADLALVGGDKDLAASKRLSYTTYSRGVLCDVKNGGLKRDLTVAFEDDATFAAVFPTGNTSDYLLIDQVKLDACTDLKTNGYIHWDVFKDHYNIKRYINTHTDGAKYLDPVRYSKDGPFLDYTGNGAVNPTGQPAGGASGSLFMAGRLGPHNIGNATTSKYSEMSGVPYGDYGVDDTVWPPASKPKNHREFKHSPVIPILQRFQANAWMEQISATTLRSHAQIWSSHYNPYNISLYAYGCRGGPRILGTPTVRPFSNALHDTTDRRLFRSLHENQNATGTRTRIERFNNVDFNSFKFEFQGKEPVMLQPGRSHVLAYEDNAQIGVTGTEDGKLYSDKVKDLTVQSVYRDLTYVNDTTGAAGDGPWVPLNLPASFDLRIRMHLMNTSMHHGVDDNNGGPGYHELCQSFWAPFAWANLNGRPGKQFDVGIVSAATLNENKMASLGFNLRTTREPGSTIRPLVDANIRCMFGNTRWDSPLNVQALAAYSIENQGEEDEMIMQMSTEDEPKGYTYWGSGRDPSFGYDRVILFDIPRADLVSLGQLQHANAGRFSYEPTYIVGNSYANPRISQSNWRESIADTFSTTAPGLANFPISGNFNLYDASYLVNEVLWDRYTFTTIPQVADNVTSLTEYPPDADHFVALANGEAKLANARYLPYTPDGSKFDKSTLQMASNKAAGTGAFYHNAGHVLVDGAFNVNSTSVDAWEAFLSSTHSLPFAKVDGNGKITGFNTTVDTVRFPRVQSVFGEGVKKSELDGEGFWTGFRKLEQSEVRELAEAIVDEVEKRGPFLSMADFVNRKLADGELGESGALQSALDKTVNSGIDSSVALGEQGAGFPGQLLQGDILQALGPRMTVRSDVFTIRAYGECLGSATGKVLARAWCEAKVQRFPDPLTGSGSDALQELSNPSSPFGRKFRMISFRWLNPDEI
jgi:hypothetical protein